MQRSVTSASLAITLREPRRIERSLFILDWLQSVELRQRVHAGLNKVLQGVAQLLRHATRGAGAMSRALACRAFLLQNGKYLHLKHETPCAI
jgi:hypothetical protein